MCTESISLIHTLFSGLFLGFSFFDVISRCLDKTTHLIQYVSGKEVEIDYSNSDKMKLDRRIPRGHPAENGQRYRLCMNREMIH